MALVALVVASVRPASDNTSQSAPYIRLLSRAHLPTLTPCITTPPG
jgi:hypothetical protein